MNNKKNYEQIALLMALVAFIILAANDIGRPPVDLHQFRQTQTLSIVYNFYLNGIDFLKPEIDTNGSRSTIILEFPAYQAMAAAIMKITGFNEVIPRLLNILFSIITALTLGKLAEGYIKHNSFFFVVVFFLLNPSTVFWSSIPLIDGFALMASIVSVYLFLKALSDKSNFTYTFSILFGAISVVVKVTAAFIPLFTLFLIFFIDLTMSRQLSQRHIEKIILYYIAIGVSFLCWAIYAYKVNSVNLHDYTTAGLSWYLGTMDQRASLKIWGHLLDRLLSNHFALIAVVAIPLSIVFQRYNFRNKVLAVSLIVFFCVFFYLLIFINLNYVHTYYQIPINAAFALVAGLGFSFILDFLRHRSNTLGAVLIVCMVFGMSLSSKKLLTSGWVDLAPSHSPYSKSMCEHDIGLQVKSYFEQIGVQPNLVGIVMQRDDKCWNGPHAILYYMKERGYVVESINDSLLDVEKLDFIISIYKDRKYETRSGWKTLVNKNLGGSVSEWMFSILQKDYGFHTSPVILDRDLEVYGDAAVEFNTVKRFENLNIPPFSMVNVKFSAEMIPASSSNNGYVILRSYSGGYAYDQSRLFNFKNEPNFELNFFFKTDRFDDYVLEFGQIKKGGYRISDDIVIEYETRLK